MRECPKRWEGRGHLADFSRAHRFDAAPRLGSTGHRRKPNVNGGPLGLRPMDWSSLAFRLVLPLLPTLLAIVICMPLEKRWPARPGERRDGLTNIKVWAASFTVQALVLPALGGLTTLAVNAAGGG